MNCAIAHSFIWICCSAWLAHGGDGTTPVPSPGRGPMSPTAFEPPVGQAAVTHAGGAVKPLIPAEWSVMELPLDRQVRLLLSPDPLANGAGFHRGIWLSLYYHEKLEPLSDAELVERARALLQSRYRKLEVVEAPAFDQLDPHRFVRLDFTLPRRRAGWTNRQERRRQAGSSDPSETSAVEKFLPPQIGFYMLVQLDWGLCEICGITPATEGQELGELQRIVSGLRLSQPEPNNWRPTPATADASMIFGSWKAFKSRLRIKPNAEITILADASFTYTTRDDDNPRTGNEITGGYVAEDDLLLVTWLDGSKLNYRWRLLDNKLLLTDHKGRTTRLLRILE